MLLRSTKYEQGFGESRMTLLEWGHEGSSFTSVQRESLFLLPEFLDVQSIPCSGSYARNCSVPGSSGKWPRIYCVTAGILAKAWQKMSWKVIILFGHSKTFSSLLPSLSPAGWAVLEPLSVLGVSILIQVTCLVHSSQIYPPRWIWAGSLRESHRTFVITPPQFAAKCSPEWPFACLQSCDLWSLGVIIYVMLCGYPPFYSKHHSRTIPKDMRKKIMTGSFEFPEEEWSQISEMAKDIVRKWVHGGNCACLRNLNVSMLRNWKSTWKCLIPRVVFPAVRGLSAAHPADKFSATFSIKPSRGNVFLSLPKCLILMSLLLGWIVYLVFQGSGSTEGFQDNTAGTDFLG